MTTSCFLNKNYTRHIKVFDDALEQYAIYLSKLTGDSLSDTKKFIQDHYDFNSYADKTDPKLIINIRDKVGDKRPLRTSLSQYVKTITNSNLIIAPSGTTYLQPEEEESLIAKSMADNVKIRNKYKKIEFKAEQEKDYILATSSNLMQNLVKGINNSYSGTMGTETGPLSNPSGHSSLTSTTRTVTSYGNANNEKFIAGHRHYYDETIVIANILSILQSLDDKVTDGSTLRSAMTKVMDKYKLHYPNTEEVLEVIKHSTTRYWVTGELSSQGIDLVNKLSPIEKAAFCYIGDFYHIRKFNNDWVRHFIANLIQREFVLKPSSRDINSFDEAIRNHVHIVFYQESKGLGKNYDEMAKQGILPKLLASAESMEALIQSHEDLIEVFFRTRNVPSEVSRIQEAVRDVVTLSDTDSTGVSVDEWVIWYRHELIMDEISLSIASSIMYLASQVLVHNLALLSANIGVPKAELHRLAMKNEFFWTSFIVALAKHYYALTVAKEGHVYDEPKIEVKGVHFKNSNIPKVLMQLSDKMKLEILNTSSQGKPINLLGYLKQIAKIEIGIIEAIQAGNISYLKTLNVKDKTAYNVEPEKSNYRHHLWWEEVMSPSYGHNPNPPYRTVKISVNLGSKRLIQNWLETIKDPKIKEGWSKYTLQSGRVDIKTLYIRSEYIENNGIPPEIIPVINYKHIVLDLCNMFYLILSTIGYQKYDNLLLKDLGY